MTSIVLITVSLSIETVLFVDVILSLSLNDIADQQLFLGD